MVAISTLISLYVIYTQDFDIYKLLIRFRDDVSKNELVSISLVNGFYIRPMPALCFLIFKCINKERHKNSVESYLLFLTLLTNAPTAIPRFMVAAIYIPVLFTYSKIIREKYNFSITLLVSIFFVFPLLNVFRNLKFDVVFDIRSILVSGHFDSYQLFLRVFENNIITYGHQLLGVILFFVPRSIWPDKPIGSGYFIAHEFSYIHDNLSMNFIGEGYINFGICGSFIFVVLLAFINGKSDACYWYNRNNTLLFKIIFMSCLGFEFVILRGALLNVLPMLVGYILSLRTLLFICKRSWSIKCIS